MVAGKPVAVQSPASNRLLHAVVAAGPLGVLLRRRREGRAPLAHDLPRRQRRREARRPSRPPARSSAASVSRGTSSRRSALLIVTDSRSGKGEQPFDGAVDAPRSSAASAGGGSMRKCALTMARNSVGVVRSGTSVAATSGGTARITRIVRARARPCRSPKSSAGDPVRRECERAQPMAELRPCTLRSARKLQRRLDEGRPEPVARDQRPAGPAARASVSRTIAPASAGARLLRLGVERREQQRPRQALVERTRALHAPRRSSARRTRQQQPSERQDSRSARRARHAALRIENPPRQPARIDAQRPALAAREIDEGKLGRAPDRRAGPRRRSPRERPARRDCPTAADDCRCRSSCRARGS